MNADRFSTRGDDELLDDDVFEALVMLTRLRAAGKTLADLPVSVADRLIHLLGAGQIADLLSIDAPFPARAHRRGAGARRETDVEPFAALRQGAETAETTGRVRSVVPDFREKNARRTGGARWRNASKRANPHPPPPGGRALLSGPFPGGNSAHRRASRIRRRARRRGRLRRDRHERDVGRRGVDILIGVEVIDTVVDVEIAQRTAVDEIDFLIGPAGHDNLEGSDCQAPKASSGSRRPTPN